MEHQLCEDSSSSTYIYIKNQIPNIIYLLITHCVSLVDWSIVGWQLGQYQPIKNVAIMSKSFST